MRRHKRCQEKSVHVRTSVMTITFSESQNSDGHRDRARTQRDFVAPAKGIATCADRDDDQRKASSAHVSRSITWAPSVGEGYAADQQPCRGGTWAGGVGSPELGTIRTDPTEDTHANFWYTSTGRWSRPGCLRERGSTPGEYIKRFPQLPPRLQPI